MKASSGIGSRRQAILLGALAVLLVLAVVRWSSSGSRSAAAVAAAAPPRAAAVSGDPVAEAAPARRGGPARKAVAAEDVPSLSQEDLKPRVSRPASTGRDLFDLREPTKPPPPPPTLAPPPPPEPGDPRYVGPLPPPPPTPTPAPPPIPFKFIGSFGPRERPIAVLAAGDRLVNARAGDTVFDHFILRKVGYESIDVGFVGFPESQMRRLGIGQ